MLAVQPDPQQAAQLGPQRGVWQAVLVEPQGAQELAARQAVRAPAVQQAVRAQPVVQAHPAVRGPAAVVQLPPRDLLPGGRGRVA